MLSTFVFKYSLQSEASAFQNPCISEYPTIGPDTPLLTVIAF